MKSKISANSSCFTFAFIWFTTQFGGGFASGRQVIDFCFGYGPFVVITPVLTQIIQGVILYFICKYAIEFKMFDYRSWTNSFYSPYDKIMSNCYELCYNLVLAIATAIAFATGGATITQLLGTPYYLNTAIIGFLMLFLTIYGANLVRKAATGISILIIAGLLIIFIPNIIYFRSNIGSNFNIFLSQTTSQHLTGGFWKALIYASLQIAPMGAYLPHAAALGEKINIKKAVILGTLINASLMLMVSLGILGLHDKGIAGTVVPTLTVVTEGIGKQFLTPIVSILIFLGSVSTGVNLIFGIVKRVVSWLERNEEKSIKESKQKSRSMLVAIVYIILTWSIAQFGLIPLIAKGYSMVGYLTLFVVVIPVLIRGILGWKKPIETSLEEEIKNLEV